MILVFTILAGILVLLRLDHSISRQVETYADQFGTQSLPVVLTTVVWILSRGSFLVGGILALVLLLYLNAINLLMDGITYIAWLIRTRVAVPDVSAYQRLRSHVFALDKRFIGFSAVLAAAYIGVILVSWIRNGEVLEHEAMNTLAGLVSIISFFYLLFYSYSNYRFCRNSEPGHSARDQLFGRTKRMSLFASLINVVFGFGMFFGLLLFTQLIVIPWAEQVAERRSSFLAYEFIDSVQPHSLSERDQEYLISIADSVNHTSDVVSIAANMILNGTYDREALRKANQIRIPQPVFRAVLLSMALLSAAILAAVCIINPLLELMLKRRALSLHESLYGRKRSTHSL